MTIYDYIYWASTTVVVVTWLFSIRFYKRAGIFRIGVITLYMITALLWYYIVGNTVNEWVIDISNMLYDLSLLTGALCILKDLVWYKHYTCIIKDCKRRKIDD